MVVLCVPLHKSFFLEFTQEFAVDLVLLSIRQLGCVVLKNSR